MGLSDTQRERYARHLMLDEIGQRGQEAILRARVLLVGAGGIGSPVALYLAAAGVGTLSIMDSDVVELSNLQRQILHSTPDLGRPKVDSARETCETLNPDCTVLTIAQRLTPENAPQLLRGHDVVVDGSDNFLTRFLVNDTCVALGIPLVSAAVLRFEGQLTTVMPPAGVPQASGFHGEGHCIRCLFEAPPDPEVAPSCERAGVLGVLPGVMGTLAATEVLKIITGVGELMSNRLLIYDALAMKFRIIEVRRNPSCVACAQQG